MVSTVNLIVIVREIQVQAFIGLSLARQFPSAVRQLLGTVYLELPRSAHTVLHTDIRRFGTLFYQFTDVEVNGRLEVDVEIGNGFSIIEHAVVSYDVGRFHHVNPYIVNLHFLDGRVNLYDTLLQVFCIEVDGVGAHAYLIDIG